MPGRAASMAVAGCVRSRVAHLAWPPGQVGGIPVPEQRGGHFAIGRHRVRPETLQGFAGSMHHHHGRLILPQGGFPSSDAAAT